MRTYKVFLSMRSPDGQLTEVIVRGESHGISDGRLIIYNEPGTEVYREPVAIFGSSAWWYFTVGPALTEETPFPDNSWNAAIKADPRAEQGGQCDPACGACNPPKSYRKSYDFR